MPVLLLRLRGPMQSRGIESRFTHRDTAREPSKSGVVGLLGAALGMAREDEMMIERLAELRMGVRVDREGRVASDFHTAGGGTLEGRPYGVARASGGGGAVVVSRRDTLQDADFLVGLQTTNTCLLHRLDRALAAPAWPLYLGRRGFMPTLPLCLGTLDTDLVELLEQWPWQHRHAESPPPEGLRLVVEVPVGASAEDAELCETRWDAPVCFCHTGREYRQRRVATRWIPVPQAAAFAPRREG